MGWKGLEVCGAHHLEKPPFTPVVGQFPSGRSSDARGMQRRLRLPGVMENRHPISLAMETRPIAIRKFPGWYRWCFLHNFHVSNPFLSFWGVAIAWKWLKHLETCWNHQPVKTWGSYLKKWWEDMHVKYMCTNTHQPNITRSWWPDMRHGSLRRVSSAPHRSSTILGQAWVPSKSSPRANAL